MVFRSDEIVTYFYGVSVSEADSIKSMRLGNAALGITGGVEPIIYPRRKRGFYRALKRSELWAVLEQNRRAMLSSINYAMFASVNAEFTPGNCFKGLSEIVKGTDEG